MRIAGGSYSGNGTSQNITTPGWAADLVIVKGGTGIMQVWTSAMGSTRAKPAIGSTALDTTTGISQHASGFSVSSNAAINTNGTTYYWLAINDNAVADFQVGSYTGNGSDNRDLALLDFDPNWVLIASAVADAVVMRYSTTSGDASLTLNGAPTSNAIQSLITNGWQVGTATTVNNADGRTYYYVALKNSDITKVIDDGNNRAWQGTGIDNRTVTGAGFTPDAFALVKSAGAVSAVARFSAHSGDQSSDVDASSATSVDRIQAFAADGLELGTNTRVNAAGTDYRALVLKAGSTSTPVSTGGATRMTLTGVG